MTKIPFSQLGLAPEIEKAIDMMGFDFTTSVQSEAIPLIRTGADVIARSQTGTGKTVAFAIPAIEKIDIDEKKNSIQVLILCPTRELAQQGADEIRKVARFNTNVHPVEIYGGAAMDKQCIRLRKANIVIGTPGRIMDHMRRKTIKLDNLKMIVLDEADEMLSMGFKEDIETILTDTPEDRQTVLFSATMPPSILKLTKDFQKDPQMVDINKSQVTIKDIKQCYMNVHSSGKKDALSSLLKFHKPNRAIIFCNTKRMVDELSEHLSQMDLSVESIHSDIKQSQRTTVMQGFKRGKTSILIATDIAARGIDVSDVEFVINYGIPPNTEYYIHRIGRTGRAGKSGCSITICTSNREVRIMRNIASETKSDLTLMSPPTAKEIQQSSNSRIISSMESALLGDLVPAYEKMVDSLIEKGYPVKDIATVALQLHFNENIYESPESLSRDTSHHKFSSTSSKTDRIEHTGNLSRDKSGVNKAKHKSSNSYDTIIIDIGMTNRVTANHIIGAITECTPLTGSEIGKIDILLNQTTIEIPFGRSDEIVKAMAGSRICGKQVHTLKLAESSKKRNKASDSPAHSKKNRRTDRDRSSSFGMKKSHRSR